MYARLCLYAALWRYHTRYTPARCKDCTHTCKHTARVVTMEGA